MPISESEVNALISERRALSGESYETARKAVLEYLKAEGSISPEEYERLKRSNVH